MIIMIINCSTLAIPASCRYQKPYSNATNFVACRSIPLESLKTRGGSRKLSANLPVYINIYSFVHLFIDSLTKFDSWAQLLLSPVFLKFNLLSNSLIIHSLPVHHWLVNCFLHYLLQILHTNLHHPSRDVEHTSPISTTFHLDPKTDVPHLKENPVNLEAKENISKLTNNRNLSAKSYPYWAVYWSYLIMWIKKGRRKIN